MVTFQAHDAQPYVGLVIQVRGTFCHKFDMQCVSDWLADLFRDGMMGPFEA